MTSRTRSRGRRFRRLLLLTSRHRGREADAALARVLALVAGCANAGGFIFLGRYTSHMTGYLSQLADSVALHSLTLAVQSLAAIALFIGGSACSAILINWARANSPGRQYALPIACQGALFLCLAALGLLGDGANGAALGLLCFIMGLQNATITKISGAVIRTTHATGMITDIGIELGRGIYGRAARSEGVRINRPKLSILTQLVCAFVIGGVAGAFGYGAFGVWFSVPLGLSLLAISAPRLV
jgi:uncharacterized membrane protein YoaK (UPF0700 family)